MRTKEIIEIINIYGINVVYVTLEKLHKRISEINSSLPINFTPLNSKEKKMFDKSKDQENFISKKPEIQFLDCDSVELENFFKISDPDLYLHTLQEIEPFSQSNIQPDVIYTMYIFLHEIGHYKQFIRLGNKVHAYINQDSELREKNYYDALNFHNSTQKHRSQYTLTEEIYSKKLLKDYRNIPMEKDADEFALNNLEEALNLYKSKI